jgi:RHS repeat-associated protein
MLEASHGRRSIGRALTTLLLTAVVVGSSIIPSGIVLAASPSATTPPPDKGGDEQVIAQDTGRVVARPPITLGIAGTAGAGGAGGPADPAVDPSIALRPDPVRTVPPKQSESVDSLWTEGSRTTANPDGTLTLETTGGRMNYQDGTGAWQPIDLHLVPDASDGYDLRVAANDRTVRFGASDAEDALASLTSDQGSVAIRAVDFPSRPVESPATPAATEPPDASPVPADDPAPADPPEASPSASPQPSASDAAEPSGPTEIPSGEPASSPEPAPLASADPSPTPPAAELDEPPPSDPGETSSRLRFAKDAASGQVYAGPTDTGFEFGVVLAAPDQASRYAFALELDGLVARLDTDGRTVLLFRMSEDERGVTRETLAGVISAPVMLDANEVPGPLETVAVELHDPAGGDPGAGLDAASQAALAAGEVVLVYAIDPTWLADPERLFPVTLDPSACLGQGVSGCDINGTSGNGDTFVMSGLPTQYPVGWTVLRVGDANDSYDNMRSLIYFKDVALPDGAVVYDSNLRLRVSSLIGGASGKPIRFYRIKTGWSSTTTWNQWDSGAGYDTSPYKEKTIPSSGYLDVDVDEIVQSWYTRRGKDWKPDLGFLVRVPSETVANGAVQFKRSSDGTAAYRPALTISYQIPKVSIDFDPALGPNYSPSTMIAGQSTTLPVRVSNNGSGFDFTTSQWLVGYRWFDTKGELVSSATQALPACVGTGGGCSTTSATIGLAVTPPTAVGQYTLRLELMRTGNPNDVWVSDYARPSLYYSRNKKTLSADNTRWVGSSVIERDEFGIGVVAGGGDTGNAKSVDTGDGGRLAIDLWSKNLSYSGSVGVGFDDLIPLDLGYTYDSKNTATCSGILSACGWATSYDERFIETAGTTFTYVGPDGNQYLVDNDADQQLTSGAPNLLERVRTTLFDEQVPSVCCSAVSLIDPSPGFTPVAGQYVLRTAYNASPVDLGYSRDATLNTFRNVRFGVRTSAATTAGVGFQIKNVTTGASKWFVYTIGSSSWSVSDPYLWLNQSVGSGAWTYVTRNLYQDVRDNGAFGAAHDEYRVDNVRTYFKSGATGYAYLDALRLEPTESAIIEEANPSWSTNAGLTSAVSGDAAAGSTAIRVNQAALGNSPDCNTTAPTTPCWGTTQGGLWSYAFVHWQWKKVGGSSAAVVFHLKDERTGTTSDITYFAGPTPPPGAVNPIQVSDATPVGWSTVTRNLLQDARQVLNYYNDSPLGTSASAPPSQGPTPDDVRLVGYKVAAVDGNFVLIDDFDYGTLPDVGAEQLGAPTSSSDTTFTYDFKATYRDGSIHSFNNRGLLTRIADRDGHAVGLDWSVPDPTVYSAIGYRLDRIHAATDATTSAAGTYDREIELSYGSGSVTFTEKLGLTSAPVTGRSTIFNVAASASSDYGIGDVLSIKPARAPSCAASGTPSGCAILRYTDGTNHRLAFVGDPRWDQTSTSGANDLRFEATWSGGAPAAIVDRSQGATPILRVLSYDVGGALPAATRPAWQDAAGLAKNFASYVDMTSDGRAVYEYIPLSCGAADCASLPSTTGLSSRRAVANEFDGLARVSTSTAYRCPGVAVSGCPGTTAQPVVSRQGTKASAKVDNYNDPLTAGQVGWTQNPDQYVSSLRDSGGLDPDLYRTFSAYDENGQQVALARPAYNARPDYPAAIKNTVQSTSWLKGYWRLEETSGTAADASGNGGVGTFTNFAVGYGSTAGALVGSPGAAPSFDGVDDYIDMASFPSVSGSYSVEAWFRPADITTTPMTIAGSRTGADKTFDLKISLGTGTATLYADVGSGSAWLATAIEGPLPSYVANRWYHAALTVNDAADLATLFIDGQPIASATIVGTPMLTDATRKLRIGQTGLTATPQPFKGGLDEVAVYSQALTPRQVQSHYLAGRSVALDRQQALYDRNWRAIQTDDQSLASPGFESGLVDWDFGWGSGGTVYTATTLPDANVHQPTGANLPASWASFKTGLTGNAQQDVQLVPGQTARFQVWHKRVGSTGSARINLYYWQRSSGSWQTLVNGSYTDTVWTGRAWDVTLPFDTDGRVRVALWVSGASGSDTIYYDDAVLLTSYGRTTYTATPGDPFDGLVRDQFTFAPTQTGSIPEFSARSSYAATTGHPAIFPTTVTANYVDGVYSSATPDVDVSTVSTFDAWGHALVTTDQDGVASTTGYQPTTSVNGYATDVISSADGLGQATTFGYDRVGNQTSSTTPLSEATTTTYNLRGQPLTVTDPLSRVTKHVYDGYGFRTSSIANRIDDTPSGPAGLDDVVTTYAYDEYGAPTTTTANTGVSGTVRSRTESLHDLLGTELSRTDYATFDGTDFGGGRTTTSHAELASGAWRATPSAVRGPGAFAPTSAPAPYCPDSATVRCNQVDVLDQDGRSIRTIDAYGIASRTLRDLAGSPVFEIANYVDGVYSSGSPAEDLITTSQLDLFGRPAATIDVLGRKTVTAFDALGRATTVTSYGSDGVAVAKTRTVYTGAGRVDRVSRPGASGAADSALVWTKSVYDMAGQQIKTLANFAINGDAGLAIASFERTSDDVTIADDGIAESWTAAAGTWIAAGATITRDGGTDTKSGAYRLRVSLSSAANTGTEWRLDGTFKTSHTYKARVWVSPAGQTITGQLGVAASSGTATVSGTGWQPLDLIWTPTSDQTTARLGIYRASTGSAVDVLVDDAMVWDDATPALNIPSETAFDPDGNITASVIPPGTVGTAETSLVTITAYDALGRVTSITARAVTGGGTGASDINLTTTTAYDALGRVSTETDPRGTVTKFDYDRLGRLTATTLNSIDGSPGGQYTDDDIVARFGYDAAGELTGYCTAVQVYATGCDETSSTNSQAWRYAYDDAGRMTLQTPPLNQTLTPLATSRWLYDAGGRLTKRCEAPAGTTDCAAGGVLRTVTPTYDPVGRVTRSDSHSGPGTTLALRTETTYLGDGQPAQTKYSEGTGPTVVDTIDYQYDPAGRPIKLLRGATVLSEQTYNPDGTLASRKDGDANAIGTSTFGYDWAGRLTSVDLPDSFSTAVPTFTWRLDGLLGARTWSAGSLTFAYDGAKRLTGQTKGSLTENQTYDRAGNVTSESRSFPGVTGDPGTTTQSFSYDGLSRVSGSSGLASGSRSYTYDRDGNRRTKVEGGLTYTYATDRTDELVSVIRTGGSTQNFSYDAYGNLTGDAQTGLAVTAMTYDLADKLTGIDAAGTANDATFTFDALGRFRTRSVNGSTDTYSYLATGETVLRVVNGGTTVDSPVSPASERLGVKSGSSLNWFLPDPHGNVAGSLDATETTLVNAIRYDAYGQTIATGSAGGTSVGADVWKYQGRLDVSPAGLSTPLYDMSARFYNPGIGAFTGLDTVMGGAQNPLSMNRFLYALANPATLIDPSGHFVTMCDGGCGTGSPAAVERAKQAGKRSGTARPRAAAIDVVDQSSRPEQWARNFKAGRDWEIKVEAMLNQTLDPTRFRIVHNNTIKDPRTGLSVDRKRPDFQIFDRATGRLIKIIDAKSSSSIEGLQRMTRDAMTKYTRSGMNLPSGPVPVEVVGELRPVPISPRINAGRILGGSLMLLTIFDLWVHPPTLEDLIGPTYPCPPYCVG